MKNGRQAGAMVMPTHGHIARALEELQSERAHLAARLAKVDEAIANLRELFHLPAIRASRKARTSTASTNGNGHGGISEDAIRAALKAGPKAPRELAQQLGATVAAVRYQARKLEDAGVVMSSGTTANRKIALAGKPAKEAP